MPIQPSIKQCTHIKLNGYRCGSPALMGQRLCYFHARMRRGTKSRLDAAIPPLLLLEDAESIQGALMQVIDMLLYDQIELKKARLVLHAIEVAARNVQNLQLEHQRYIHDEDYEHFEEDMVQDLGEEETPEISEGDDADEGATEPCSDEQPGAAVPTFASPLPERVLPDVDGRLSRRSCPAGVACGWDEGEEAYLKEIGRLNDLLDDQVPPAQPGAAVNAQKVPASAQPAQSGAPTLTGATESGVSPVKKPSEASPSREELARRIREIQRRAESRF